MTNISKEMYSTTSTEEIWITVGVTQQANDNFESQSTSRIRIRSLEDELEMIRWGSDGGSNLD